MSSSVVNRDDVWTRLGERFPWPDECPDCRPVPWSLDYGGRSMITRMIRKRQLRTMLEIGVFVGGSTRQWLSASPDLAVVAVDIWDSTLDPSFILHHPLGKVYGEQLLGPDGYYRSFLASMWDVRDRVVPVRGRATDMLPQLRALGLDPDLIYIDSDKSGDEIALCAELFPRAVLSGDDWYWHGSERYPIRPPVRQVCRAQGRHLKQACMTWIMDHHPYTFTERLNRWRHLPYELVLSLYSEANRLRGRDGNFAQLPSEKKVE